MYAKSCLFNQIMVATLRELNQNRNVEKQIRKEAFYILDQLNEIDNIYLSRGLFLRLTFGRHNVYYKRMLHLARLLHEMRLLSHKKGDWSLYTVDISESEMNRLFEQFLFHFYRVEQEDYTVKSERLSWNLTGNESLLPSMRTDVSLIHRYERKRIVIDAKFYKNIFQKFHGKNSFHSHNMYQMFAYMVHQPVEDKVRGILIYPENFTEEISESYSWDERLNIEIYSLNLNSSWDEISQRLKEILE